jgi:hypothetical protein
MTVQSITSNYFFGFFSNAFFTLFNALNPSPEYIPPLKKNKRSPRKLIPRLIPERATL